MRALEKRLGEPLREDETGRWVVLPAQQGSTATTLVKDFEWPKDGPRQDIPEYEREDCLPQIVPAWKGSVEKPLLSSGGGMQRSGSIVRRARNALTRAKKEEAGLGSGNGAEGIEVFVGRDVQVVETGYKKLETAVVSPSLSLESQTSMEEDEEDVKRRQRRLQIAKVCPTCFGDEPERLMSVAQNVGNCHHSSSACRVRQERLRHQPRRQLHRFRERPPGTEARVRRIRRELAGQRQLG